ncbi:hypothetical protein D0B54_04730 [Solimonas sp. K1W22B-7]|uniref:hypothetical protein n=1 Tax=Solimonas sp. K1W22B-7 TaxID=2303331 RepID=UPI000E331B33|nr:hypothetical protein [Solimonas sp. K1W22B-7]AXQ28018.1 hypothetical protein D0B54_04730 [Solimonas sp. K1W22B-7]
MNPIVVTGSILRLRCQACGALFPHFQFSGERETEAGGLFSASSGKLDEVFIAEATEPEWKDFDRAGATLAEQRLAQQLGREDLRVIRLLRIESALTGGQGMSFADFKKSYRPPVMVYSCAGCGEGESKLVEEISVEEFQLAGGNVRLADGLVM